MRLKPGLKPLNRGACNVQGIVKQSPPVLFIVRSNSELVIADNVNHIPSPKPFW